MKSHPPERLVTLAREVRARAYAPYSRFRVGAALEAETGEVFTGCNVENASYGLTMCAEQAAVASAVARGRRRFRRLVVATGGERAVAPCGRCRQLLAEFGTGLEVYGVTSTEQVRWLLPDLIPYPFAGDLLNPVPGGGGAAASPGDPDSQ